MKNDSQYFTGEAGIKSYAQQNDPDVSVHHKPDYDLFKSLAGWSDRTYVDHDTNISVKSEYHRGDYEYFRPSQSVPKDQLAIIEMCLNAYNQNGIVRNIVDLMADFATYGVDLQHTRKSTENFYKKWFHDIVKGPELASAFTRQLLKAGNIIIKRSNGKIPILVEKEWKRTDAAELELPVLEVEKREIPIKYIFLNPSSVNIIGGELSNFIGKPLLELKIPLGIRSAINAIIRSDKTQLKGFLDSIPKDILAALQRGAYTIPLDMNSVELFYYKKDDWLPWSYPLTYSMLKDLIALEKMKLADISALDGAISNIRLWTLGVLDGVNSILPNKSVINKLKNILANNIGGGVMDLVWGPELKFTESNTAVWQFLGSGKYEPILNAIYDGFGIPPSLRGSGGSGTNVTGNYVSLNTMVKRLQYIRDVFIRFLKKELQIVHNAMGFKGPLPRIVFDNMVLADEAAEKQLILNMWDRDLISTESVQTIFGRIPEVETARIYDEMQERESENMPEKASPFHNPDKEHEYKKILLQGGDVTASEVGLELGNKKLGERPRLEVLKETQIAVKKAGPLPGTSKIGVPGRPLNITETKKRKPKPTNKPSTKADVVNMALWANKAQGEIAVIANEAFLAILDHKNMRQLTYNESEQTEWVKFGVLCAFEPFEEITKEKVCGFMSNGAKVDNEIISTFTSIRNNFIKSKGHKPKTEELRQLYVNTYCYINLGEE